MTANWTEVDHETWAVELGLDTARDFEPSWELFLRAGGGVFETEDENELPYGYVAVQRDDNLGWFYDDADFAVSVAPRDAFYWTRGAPHALIPIESKPSRGNVESRAREATGPDIGGPPCRVLLRIADAKRIGLLPDDACDACACLSADGAHRMGCPEIEPTAMGRLETRLGSNVSRIDADVAEITLRAVVVAVAEELNVRPADVDLRFSRTPSAASRWVWHVTVPHKNGSAGAIGEDLLEAAKRCVANVRRL